MTGVDFWESAWPGVSLQLLPVWLRFNWSNVSDDNNTVPRVFYRVRDWNIRFENNRSREVQHLDWVKTPLLLGSEQWIELLDHPDGASHLGVWHAVIQLAARCRPRGTLIRFNGAPHTPETIAKAATLLPSLCRQAVDRLTTIGWLEQLSFTQQAVTDGIQVPPARQNGDAKVPTPPQEGAASRRARGLEKSRDISTPPPPPSRGAASANGNGAHRTTKREQHADDFAKRQETRVPHA